MSNRSQLFILLLLFAVLAIAIPYNMERADQAAPPPTTAQVAWATNRARFLAYMKKQPGIKDAYYTDQNWLYVVVLDDGTDWDAYSSSACKMLVGRGVTDVVAVKMTDTVKGSDGEGFHQLGQSSCR